MEMTQVLHMNKGAGDTSYAQNSTVQSKIISIGKPAIEKAIERVLSRSVPESIGIADLGCSSGPNTLRVISDIIKLVHAKREDASPELRLFLNDLFNNDFNYIFASLPEFYGGIKKDKKGSELFVSGVPGSFYGRLFPRKSLHFVHSSSSLHWLSRVPRELEKNAKMALNKGKIYMSKSSPKRVLEAYKVQFEEDFGVFLRSRSDEVVFGGRMVLSFMGRISSDPTTHESCYQWELLAIALMAMVSEGLIEEEKVDSFNAPYYAPSPEEVKNEVEKEGHFFVESLEAFQVEWDGCFNIEEYFNNLNNTHAAITLEDIYKARGRKVAKTIRAVVESMLESHFGTNILDDLFSRYQDLVTDYLSKSSTKYINLVISLVKRDD